MKKGTPRASAFERLGPEAGVGGSPSRSGSDLLADIRRISEALSAATDALAPFTSGRVEYRVKTHRGDPVTEADLAVDRVLRELLPQVGEGWLSEETVDDPVRLECERVWVVDPIDGTREFVDGVPEWCVSIGLVVGGFAVAGGIVNPVTDETILGAVDVGVSYNGVWIGEVDPIVGDAGAGGGDTGSAGGTPTVLASRSEVRRGEWARYADAPFVVRPCGSVAYKLGLVAAGKADAMWTLTPKSEWDVAAGAALVRAAGGRTFVPGDRTDPPFNQRSPTFPGFVAAGPGVGAHTLDGWLNDT